MFVVELVFQSQEVLVQGNSVSQQGFVARGFIFLVDFSVLEQFDLMFHYHNLFLEVKDQLLFQAFGHLALSPLGNFLLLLVVFGLQIGIAFKFFVDEASVGIGKSDPLFAVLFAHLQLQNI